MFAQSDITKRVLTVYQYLSENGMVSSQLEFCQLIGYHNVSFAQVIRQKRDFPDALLPNICDIFNVNLNYLNEGKKPMFIHDKPPLKSIHSLKEFREADEILRIRVKDLNITQSDDGMLIQYMSLDNKRHIIELINK